MTTQKEDKASMELRDQLKALSNRHAIGILQVLSPETGEMVPSKGWDLIVEGLLALDGVKKPGETKSGEKTAKQATFEEKRQNLMSGGTIYETMNKLIKAKFVVPTGDKGRKQRGFMITHKGRLALAAVGQLGGPIGTGTIVQEAAKILLKHKNFVSLLPAQEKFIREVGNLDENLVIQMPPGSGKTFLAMIAVLINLQKGVRCLYLSPYISLSRQIIEEYGPLFEELGYSVVRLDGSCPATNEELERANLVVVMYESLLSALLQRRKWTEKIGLTVVDELTELGSVRTEIQAASIGTDRSTKLDSIITMMKKSSQIITLSSRFGDTDAVTDWLEAKVFRPDVRLRPDEFTVMKRDGVVTINSSDGTQKSSHEQEDVLDAIMDHMERYEDKSILIVVGARSRAQGIARKLAHTHPRVTSEELVSNIIGAGEYLPLCEELQKTMMSGIAFHHSGLDAGVRERLEKAIKTRQMRTVIATTGITSGISFPFDCVIILLDSNMYFLSTRARYLQMAGRIGEYHLRKHGGRIYLVFEGLSRQFTSLKKLEETLLHKPLEPLSPGDLYPSLVVGILMQDALKRRNLDRKQLKDAFLSHANATLRARDEEYAATLEDLADKVIDWLISEGVFEKADKGLRICKDSKEAILAGMDLVDYLTVRRDLNIVKEEELIDLLLDMRLPQVIRPVTLLPLIAELEVLNLEPPDDWYLRQEPDRRNVKKMVLERWMNEEEVSEIIREARETVRGVSLDEGDLASLLGVCSAVALSLGNYLVATKRKDLGQRIRLLSRQLEFGVMKDLAGTDLLELQLIPGERATSSRLSREDARVLFEQGYKSITDIVRKDLGASKKGLARDRFARHSGLDEDHALDIYKAAMKQIRLKFEE